MKERNVFEILSVLDRNNKPMTSEDICRELCDLGLHLTDRMIRNYLQDFDEKGLTEQCGREGRCITEKGRDELRASFVYARSDYILTKICRVVSDANFDINRRRGEVPISASLIDAKKEAAVKRVLRDVCGTKLFPQLLRIFHSGERLCGREVPKGMIGLAVPSGVIVDEVIIKNGIYINPSSLCCLIEFIEQRPVRCTNFSAIQDVSYDPMEMWINHQVGSVYGAALKARGEAFVEYSEFPYTVRARVIPLLEKLVGIFGGTIIVGGASETMYGLRTQAGNTGLLTVCGESLPAALEENGIKTNTETIAGAINFKELEAIAPVKGEVILL